MKIVLIRHGATKGNLEKRYIGRTDEDLCGEGIKKLKEDTCAGIYPPAQAVFSSPMKRCLSTAECIYPVQTPQIVWDFRECDFGLFEGKNYKELTGNPQYQQWIDSNGTLPFPGGEALTDFKKRSVRAFLETVSKSESILKGQVTSGKQDDTTVAYVVHGGTIMAVLSELYGGDFYDYHCGNGEGYLCSLTKDKKLSVIGKISARNGCEIHGTVLE